MVSKKPRKTTDKPRKNKAVAQVRNSAKKTQDQFARVLGWGASMLQSIEDGRRKLQLKEAERITAYCGADPRSLVEGKKAKTVGGRPYSRNSFELWRSSVVDPSAVDIAARRAALMADALVRAAYVDAGGRRRDAPRYRFVSMQLSRHFFEVAKENRIETGFREQLHSTVLEERAGEMSPNDIKKLLGIKGTGAGVLGYSALSAEKLAIHNPIPVTVKREPLLYPFAGGARITNEGRVHTDGLAMDLITVQVQLPWLGKPTTTLQAIVFKSFVTGSKGSCSSELVLPRSTRNAKLFAALGVM